MNDGWIGVDLDGTLAKQTDSYSETMIGASIPKMVDRVKKWLSEGQEVRIFTARIADPHDFDGVRQAIEWWCALNLGKKLKITCRKDHKMIELWDDRVIQVIANTGERADGKE
jgi:hypothetical protein